MLVVDVVTVTAVDVLVVETSTVVLVVGATVVEVVLVDVARVVEVVEVGGSVTVVLVVETTAVEVVVLVLEVEVVLLVVVLLQSIFTFNDFTIIYNMTQGGPAGVTRVYSILTYEVAFRSLQLGKGVAISLTMAPIIIVIVAVLARRMRRI